MRIALGLEYDGAPFCGWQHQPSGCAVQDHLERGARRRFADGAIATVAAGRTDAGVHARAQVVHFDTDAVRDERLVGAGAQLVPPGRRSASCGRGVVPAGLPRASPCPLAHLPLPAARRCGRPGDAARRRSAGSTGRSTSTRCRRRPAALAGEHDFSAFRDAQCQARSPVRTLHEATVERRRPPRGVHARAPTPSCTTW